MPDGIVAAGVEKMPASRLCRTLGCGRLEHDPEKWAPVFRKDHAQI